MLLQNNGTMELLRQYLLTPTNHLKAPKFFTSSHYPFFLFYVSAVLPSMGRVIKQIFYKVTSLYRSKAILLFTQLFISTKAGCRKLLQRVYVMASSPFPSSRFSNNPSCTYRCWYLRRVSPRLPPSVPGNLE